MIATKKDIGKTMIPADNSYSQSLRDGLYPDCNNGFGLAGASGYNIQAVPVRITSEPFTITVIKNSQFPEIKAEGVTRRMIIVDYEGEKYLILNSFKN
jgi:hypothetical protein